MHRPLHHEGTVFIVETRGQRCGIVDIGNGELATALTHAAALRGSRSRGVWGCLMPDRHKRKSRKTKTTRVLATFLAPSAEAEKDLAVLDLK